jgi:hypothetical protein
VFFGVTKSRCFAKKSLPPTARRAHAFRVPTRAGRGRRRRAARGWTKIIGATSERKIWMAAGGQPWRVLFGSLKAKQIGAALFWYEWPAKHMNCGLNAKQVRRSRTEQRGDGRIDPPLVAVFVGTYTQLLLLLSSEILSPSSNPPCSQAVGSSTGMRCVSWVKKRRRSSAPHEQSRSYQHRVRGVFCPR